MFIHRGGNWVDLQRSATRSQRAGHDWVTEHALTPMFITALFTIVKTWKQPKCPCTDEQIKKMWCTSTMEYYSVIKRNEIMPLVATWRDLDFIKQSEISQTKKDKYHVMSGNVWRDSYVLSLMSPLSLFKRNSTLLPGTEIIVWGRLGSPLVNTLFRTKLLSLLPLSWDTDCLLTLWLTLPLVPLVTVAVRLVFWSLSFLKEVSCTTAYIYS